MCVFGNNGHKFENHTHLENWWGNVPNKRVKPGKRKYQVNQAQVLRWECVMAHHRPVLCQVCNLGANFTHSVGPAQKMPIRVTLYTERTKYVKRE